MGVACPLSALIWRPCLDRPFTKWLQCASIVKDMLIKIPNKRHLCKLKGQFNVFMILMLHWNPTAIGPLPTLGRSTSGAGGAGGSAPLLFEKIFQYKLPRVSGWTEFHWPKRSQSKTPPNQLLL
jgi:hypothetical protein